MIAALFQYVLFLGLVVGLAFPLVRAMLWVLLPGSLAGSAFLLWQGVPMNLDPYTQVATLEGGSQILAQGPVAALEFIKNLGTNGGGFFNANGAHPYATPTPLAEFVAMLAIVALPAAMPIAFGHLTGRPRMGRLLLGVMVGLFALGLVVCLAVPALYLAGKLSAQPVVEPQPGTLAVDTYLFAGMILMTAFALGALTFLPVLAPGPLAEHLTLPR